MDTTLTKTKRVLPFAAMQRLKTAPQPAVLDDCMTLPEFNVSLKKELEEYYRQNGLH